MAVAPERHQEGSGVAARHSLPGRAMFAAAAAAVAVAAVAAALAAAATAVAVAMLALRSSLSPLVPFR